MKNTEKINPTCPPLYLSPPAIAVPAPTISYEYLIFKRQCFCYNHLFTLKKFLPNSSNKNQRRNTTNIN